MDTFFKLLCSLKIILVTSAVATSMFCFSAKAQNGQSMTVRGKVVDDTGQPLPGVVVMVRENKSGTMTDADGTYEIKIDPGQHIEFNSLGFITEVVQPDKIVLNITMQQDAIQLDEAAVIGYGEVKKQTLTGAVSAVSTKDLLRNATPNVGNMLMGQIPGLTTISSSGAPGADDPEIFVRGIGTLNAANSRPSCLWTE